MSIKNSNNYNGNRTHYLPVCSAMHIRKLCFTVRQLLIMNHLAKLYGSLQFKSRHGRTTLKFQICVAAHFILLFNSALKLALFTWFSVQVEDETDGNKFECAVTESSKGRPLNWEVHVSVEKITLLKKYFRICGLCINSHKFGNE